MDSSCEGCLQDMVTKAHDEAERLQNLVKKLQDCIVKAEQQVEIHQQYVVLLQQQIARAHNQDVLY